MEEDNTKNQLTVGVDAEVDEFVERMGEATEAVEELNDALRKLDDMLGERSANLQIQVTDNAVDIEADIDG